MLKLPGYSKQTNKVKKKKIEEIIINQGKDRKRRKEGKWIDGKNRK